MTGTLTAFGIAVGAMSLICHAPMTRAENRSRRSSGNRPASSGGSDSAREARTFPTGSAATTSDSSQ